MSTRTLLSAHTTIGLGGPAGRFLSIDSKEELLRAVKNVQETKEPFFVLGGGSNVVFADRGFAGTVLHMQMKGISMLETVEKERLVTVAAGEPWDSFVEWTVEHHLQGVECLSGIPGSCGATPIQNVGAYGQEVAEVIVAVDVLDTKTLEFVQFQAADCLFSYRDSRFKSKESGRYIVVAVTFRLQYGGKPEIKYAELKKAAEEAGAATLHEIRALVISIRRKKGMVVDPNDPDSRSCGSFFTNPIIEEYALDSVRRRAQRIGIDPASIPVYPYQPGYIKLSAAWLIDKAGIQKGMTRNGAGVSSKHALALVNRGGTAADLMAVKTIVQQTVKEKFGIELIPEPVFAGF